MATTEKKEVRITKANRYNDIKALLTGGEVQYGTTLEDAIEFIDKELDALARKNTKKNSEEPTEKQKQDETYKGLIMDYIVTHPEGVTCYDLRSEIEMFFTFSPSKISSLVNQLVKEGRLVSLPMKKGRRPYALA